MGEDNLISRNLVVTRRTLLDLSTEVLVEILAYLPTVCLFSVQRTCRTIHDIIAGTTYFQYIMRAYVNGVDDLLPPDFPHSERLELLRHYEQSWNSLKLNIFTQCVIDDIPSYSQFILQDGYLIYQCLTIEYKWNRYGYADLCSASQDEELHWVHIRMVDDHWHLFNTSIVTFAVDQDLMVAVRYCVASDLIIKSLTGHSKLWQPVTLTALVQLTFFQFTTGAHHPLSSTHTVSLPQDPGQPCTFISSEVLGDHVLVTVGGSTEAVLYLVSWKTGAVTLVSTSSK